VPNLETWLECLAEEPLPGAVSAAAVAAAMGAALVAKATRVTQSRQAYQAPDGTVLQAVRDEAQAQQTLLMQLAEADEQAYRAVLDRKVAEWPGLQQARIAAIEMPTRVAEASQSLLSSLPRLFDLCSPMVRTELQTGAWLLEVGVRAGQLAADTNLHSWANSAGLERFGARLEKLPQSSVGETEG